jgi:hypothetical protein
MPNPCTSRTTKTAAELTADHEARLLRARTPRNAKTAAELMADHQARLFKARQTYAKKQAEEKAVAVSIEADSACKL